MIHKENKMFSIRNHKKDKTEVVRGFCNILMAWELEIKDKLVVIDAHILSTAEKQLYLYGKFKVSFPRSLTCATKYRVCFQLRLLLQ